MGLENIPSFKKGSGIHIKKKNRGKFTKSAKAAGESVQEHAAHVLSDPNATPLQKKRANFARNAAKWKHQFGGTIRTKEEVDAINQSNRDTAKGMFKGIISGDILPTLGNVGRMIGAAYDGWLDPETVYITGEAPTDGPFKKIRLAKETVDKANKTKKIIQSVADVKDKGLTVTKKVNMAVKNGLTYDDFDARHVNAGRNRHTAAQRDQAQYIVTNHYQSSDWYNRLQDIFKKQAKSEAKGADKAVLSKFRKQRNDVLDDFLNWYNRK